MIKLGSENVNLFFDSEKGYLQFVEYSNLKISILSKLWRVETNEGTLEIADMTSFSYQSYSNMLKLFWKLEEQIR